MIEILQSEQDKEVTQFWIDRCLKLEAENALHRHEALADELQRLRVVYEAARRVLRFNGVDKAMTIAAVHELDDAVERVKSLDSGQEDDDE